jgi:hypothetical protein
MQPNYNNLCEHCRQREATVHLAVVSWPSCEQMQHLCESCYPEIEAKRTQSYNTQPPPSLPDDIEDITAAEYLDATARAASNGPDKLVLRHIGDELKRFPATRARLAIEFLTMAKHSLDQKDDACYLIADGACFGNSIEPSRLRNFWDCWKALFTDLSSAPTPVRIRPEPGHLSVASGMSFKFDQDTPDAGGTNWQTDRAELSKRRRTF